MKLNLPSASIALVLFGLCVFLIARDDNPSEGRKSASAPAHSSRQSRTKHTPESALDYYKSFATLDYNHAPSFAEFERQAKHLTDEQLYLLLEEIDPAANFAIWLRSALWAELGRRDHPDALNLLIAQADDTNFSIDAREQSAFAFFRGRLESLDTFDAIRNQLIPRLNAFHDHKSPSGWRQRTLTALFKKLASLDPEAAWEIVNQTNSSEHSDTPHHFRFAFGDNQSAHNGFFHGLESHELVQTYLTKWQPTVESEEYQRIYEQYSKPEYASGFSFRIHKIPPREEYLISNTLASLARFDPQGSLNWLLLHDLDPERIDYNRREKLWQTHAEESPRDAMQLLSDPAFSQHHFEIAATIGKNNFSLAPDIIASLASTPETQGRVLNRLISHFTRSDSIDKFPEPNRHNRIPNYQERRDQLLEAVEATTFSEEKKETYRDAIAKDFRLKLQ